MVNVIKFEVTKREIVVVLIIGNLEQTQQVDRGNMTAPLPESFPFQSVCFSCFSFNC